jgi:putative ABC transport system permease protein
MLTNYLRIAWRKIIGNKWYSIINVLGLTIGICACLMIYLITSYDLSFDKFLPDKDRIYRIVGDLRDNQGNRRFLNSPLVEVDDIQFAIHGFEAKTGFYPFGGSITIPAAASQSTAANNELRKYRGKREGSDAETSVLAGPDFFDVFAHHWLVGNPQTLDTPFRVVLTEAAARKYFGGGPLQSMIGRPIIFADTLAVFVGGIVQDWAHNSDFNYSHFISLRTAQQRGPGSKTPTDDGTSLSPQMSQAFVKLAKGVTAAQINEAFEAYIRKHAGQISYFLGDSKPRMYLQPLTEIHFTPDLHREDDGDHIEKPYLPILYALIALALFILALAAINFINLSTAQAGQRAKEVGVRKVMGSGRGRLILQFLIETLLLTLFAVLLSMLIVAPALAAFKGFVPTGVGFHPTDPKTLLFLASITIVTTILAGYYPARVLSGYAPVLSLKGPAFQKGTGKRSLRRLLIVFQFTISIVFIIGGIVIGKQLKFMHSIPKGFNSDNVLTFNNEDDPIQNVTAFYGALANATGLFVIRQAHNPMSFTGRSAFFTYRTEDTLVVQEALVQTADPNYTRFYQIPMEGVPPTSDSIRDIAINETLAHKFGFKNPGDAGGRILYYQDRTYIIKGIIQDYIERSYHEGVKPMVLLFRENEQRMVAVKLTEKDKRDVGEKSTIATAKRLWEQFFPHTPFQYARLNDSLESIYGQEQRAAWLVNVAMVVTIFISCMGIFGMGMFTAEKRAKEIGIRKTFGASVISIVTLLTRDFVFLGFVALIIASPLSWWLMNRWLLDYSSRIRISPWVFVTAGVSAMGIALLTVGYQAIRAAIANPATVLRQD